MTENIHYKKIGSGMNCLLLIHPYPVNSKFYDTMNDFLPKDWFAIIPDIPGFGQSPVIMDRNTYTLDGVASIFKEQIREIEGKFVVAGASMGGYISLSYIRMFANKVDGVILMNTRDQADGDGGKGRTAVIEMIENGKRSAYIDELLPKLLGKRQLENEEWIHKTVKLINETSDQALILSSSAMGKRLDHSELMTKSKLPKLLITGADDIITGPSVMEEMQKRYTNSQFIIIPEAGHFAPFEQPQLVGREIRQFLENV